VRQPAAAREIVLSGGERVRADDFVLPADVRYVPLAGVVFDADGVPVGGVRVYLKGSAGEDYILTEPSLTDANGRFTIAALDGREYLVFAERSTPGERGGRLEVSDQVMVAPTETSPPLVLRLRRKY
jgi:hypothetical protein